MSRWSSGKRKEEKIGACAQTKKTMQTEASGCQAPSGETFHHFTQTQELIHETMTSAYVVVCEGENPLAREQPRSFSFFFLFQEMRGMGREG
jgi:hypothetical protein